MKIQPQTLEGENPYRDEITELRLDRLGQRLTLLSVLLPIIIVVILVLGYLDLKRRVVGLQDSGTANVQTLSRDLESRFSTLSVRVAELEANVQRALGDAQKDSTDQAARMAELEGTLKRLETQKIDAAALKAATDPLIQQIAPLAEHISAQDQALKAAAEGFEAQAKAIADSLESLQAKMALLSDAFEPIHQNRQALEAEVKRLSETLKTDREAAQKALVQQKEASARQLGETVAPLKDALETLRRKIDGLQRDLSSVRVPTKPSPESGSVESPTALPSPPAGSTPKPPAAVSPPSRRLESPPVPADQPSLPDLKPGQIIEKPL